MKVTWSRSFQEYVNQQNPENLGKFNDFFSKFCNCCKIDKTETIQLWRDFELAFLYYAKHNIPIQQALSLLDTKFLGTFYEESSYRWFSLDDAAKLYPMSMKQGYMSVYRLSVCLHETIIPELLQMALDFTIKRFPAFATTLKKGFFWHYLDETNRRYRIEQEKDIPCQPIKVSRSGSPSLRVIYFQNRISVEFFHVLSDGLGSATFLIALASEYLRLTGKDILLDESVFDINDVPDKEEMENAFRKVPHESTNLTGAHKAAVQIKGKLSKVKPCRIIHFKMDALQLKSISEKYGTTVTGYLLSILLLATKQVSSVKKGIINIQVPINLRKYYDSKTIRNFVLPCGIGFPIEEIQNVSGMIPNINTQLRSQTSKKAISASVTSTERLIDFVRYVPLAIKQPVAKIGYGFLGDRAFTSILSNLGVIKIPSSLSKHIHSMDAVIGPSITQRARCALITFQNIATLSITKSTIIPDFEEEVYRLICSDGINTTIEGSELYGD